ncbi:MAG: FAD-dependent oxidoreductase [Candidatus Midichloria sp.]|nr:FAD-dependent oxidoreductase [Candidatus Midichloria sp.]
MTSFITGGNALLQMSIIEVIKDNIYLNKVLSKISFDDSTVKIEFTDQSCCNYDLVILAIPAFTHHNDICYKAMFLPIQDTIFFVGEHTTILECIGTWKLLLNQVNV